MGVAAIEREKPQSTHSRKRDRFFSFRQATENPLASARNPVPVTVARAMELLPEVESAVDALFWDRADRPKRLAALQTLLAAAACEPGVEAIRAHGGVDRLRKALAWDDEVSGPSGSHSIKEGVVSRGAFTSSNFEQDRCRY